MVVDEDAEGGPRDAGPPFPAPDNDDTEGHMPVAGRIVDPPMPEPRAIVPVEPPLRKGVVMVLASPAILPEQDLILCMPSGP